MNRRNHWFQGMIGLALLAMLAFALVVLVRRVPAQVQTGQEKTPTVALAQAPTQDLPPAAVVIGTIYPTETPPPTFTPLPTPTLRPEPTATPLALPSPASDATGSLFYAIRTKLNTGPAGYVTEGDIYQVQIDAKGELVSQPKPTKLGWMQPYPALDRSLVAFVNHTMIGDHVSMLNLKSGEIKPVNASMTHYALFSGWHPNNQEMLYRIDRNTSGGLWLMSVEKDDLTIVVQQDPLYIQDAAISPDGQRIVYVQQKGISAPSELWTVFADGSAPKLLLSDGIISGLSWSPDNQKIAFMGGGEGLCVMQIGDVACKTVAKNFSFGYGFVPVWSPDGRYLAYVTFDPNRAPSSPAKQTQAQDPDKEAFMGSNIYIVNVETGEETTPAPLKATAQISGHIDPTWSPDGKMIAFASLNNGLAGAWVVNVDGTGLHQVAEASDLIRFPVWTR